MAASMKINKNITMSAIVDADGKNTVTLYAELSTSGGNDRISQTVTDQETYNLHKTEIREQIGIFQAKVWEQQDAISAENTNGGETDETEKQ